MFRYLACVWNDADPQARAAAQALEARLQTHFRGTASSSTASPSEGAIAAAASAPVPGAPAAAAPDHARSAASIGTTWAPVMRQAGLTVFCTGERRGSSAAYRLDGGAGVVLGTLFTGAHPAPFTLEAAATAAILASRGRHLIDRYWGRYVAFFHDARSGTRWTLRDPAHGMPCLARRWRAVTVYFSYMEDAIALGLGPFTLDWSYIAAHLCCQILEIERTALHEVSRVIGGSCVEHRGETVSRAFYWNPAHIAATDPIEDPHEAAAALRATTRACVHAWAAGHTDIVHALSGGLDSSIVAACLRDAPSRPTIACFNYHSPGADTDERAYAQLAARHAGFPLIERERDIHLRLESLLEAPRSAYPVNCRYYLENSRWEAALTRERGATAIFCGEGGDQLFYQSRAHFAAGDYLSRRGLLRGLGPGLLRVALDSARLDRRSLWYVLRDALEQGVLGRRWRIREEFGQFTKLIPEEVIAAVKAEPELPSPLIQSTGHLPSGKLWHLFQTLFPAMDFYDPMGLIQDAERLTPIWSQPLITLCLRIPTDVLTVGGWERALTRRAFQHDLPRKIVIRRTKGVLDQYAKSVLNRNMSFMREFLLEGHLLRERMIDRPKLEAVLSGHPTRQGGDTVELFDLVNAEAWVQRWTGRTQRIAA